MKRKLCLLILSLAVVPRGQSARAEDSVRLLPGTPIYVSASEPEPVRRAVKDLQRDLRNVLGSDSPVRSSLDSPQGGGIVIAGASSDFAELRDSAISGREAHGVFTHGPAQIAQKSKTDCLSARRVECARRRRV